MITRARVSGCFGSSAVAGAVLLAAALAAAALTGTALGLLGAALDPATRALLAATALTAVGVGAVTREAPWQLDRETSTDWLRYRDWRTAAFNGFALGLGFTTRIGFWLYYLVPLGAFVVADPAPAAAGYALFAAARVGGSALLAGAGVWIGGGIGRARLVADPVAAVAFGGLLAVLLPLL